MLLQHLMYHIHLIFFIGMAVTVSLSQKHIPGTSLAEISLLEAPVFSFMLGTMKFRKKFAVLVRHDHRIGDTVRIKAVRNQESVSEKIESGIFADDHQESGQILVRIGLEQRLCKLFGRDRLIDIFIAV